MLNAQLESYYLLVKDLRGMKVEDKSIRTGINAELDPPRIQIPSDTESLDRSRVIYHLRIKKATIEYMEIPLEIWDSQTYPEYKLTSVDVKDCQKRGARSSNFWIVDMRE